VISLYKPGNSLVHRVNAGWKFVALTLLLLAIAFYGKNLVGTISQLVLVAGLYALAGESAKSFLKQLWALRYLILIVAVPQVIFNGTIQGFYNSVSVIVGVLLAALVSMTTKTSEIVDLLKRITRSQNFALLIALSINSIALVAGFSQNISEAAKARGVKPNPLRQIVTLFVVSLRFADDYAEALAARGVRV
jgi:biotin transport system permease protein